MAALNQTEKIKVEGLYKAYGKKTILDHIGFSVYEGEFLSVLGSSGCGKTTLLRILIGITEQNGGGASSKTAWISPPLSRPSAAWASSSKTMRCFPI